MELLYVWIDKYNNIEKQGFNISPKWRHRRTIGLVKNTQHSNSN